MSTEAGVLLKRFIVAAAHQAAASGIVSGVKIEHIPSDGTPDDAGDLQFVFADGVQLKVSFEIISNPYRKCKYCGQEIYDDSAEDDQGQTWLSKDEDSWQCPRRAGTWPDECVHEPES